MVVVGKDLPDHCLIQDNTQRPLFAQFIGTLARMSEDSQPTLFHKLLKKLEDRRTLVRAYTQNIDGLELKAGTSTYHRTRREDEHRPFKCIPLHGGLQYLYCQLCGAVEDMVVHCDQLRSGRFPGCGACKRTQEARREAGKRVQGIPQMLPDVVLYDQQHPDAQGIMEFQAQDLSGGKGIDLLLVVGTGMHVVGTQRIIRQFAQQVQRNRERSHSGPCSIYLNLDFKRRKKWETTFDIWVQADCQVVAKAVLTAMEEEDMGSDLPAVHSQDNVGGI